MSSKNRYCPSEFKREALEMLATSEHNIAQLERELGITPESRKVERVVRLVDTGNH